MPCYAISIREDKQHLLKDNGGVLFFKKKSLAVELCEQMNDLRKEMKLEQVYSVCKVDEKDWKGFPIVYDQECKHDDARRDVQRYTKRKALHVGPDGPEADSKNSEGYSQEGEGSTQALPFGV
jgi:hypothetical protein